MGSGPDFPKPTPEEKQLQSTQADMLNQQRLILQDQYKQQQLLAPILFKQNNIKPIYADTGFGGPQEIIGYEDLGPTPEQEANRKLLDMQMRQMEYAQALQPLQMEQQGYRATLDENGKPTKLELIPGSIQDLENQTAKRLLERQNQALDGTLPVDPALQRQFDRSDQVLASTLRKNLGEGYATSTPGIQAQAEAESRRQAAIYAAQHGEIGYAGQLADAALSRFNTNSPYNTLQRTSTSAQYLSPFAAEGTTNARSAQLIGTIEAPYRNTGGFGTLSQLYGNALQPYQAQRANEYQADLAQSQNNIANIFSRNFVGSFANSFGNSLGNTSGSVIKGAIT